ncbi:hypothetical protein [Anaerobiospirillum sp. NML120449]|uniref:hypothetical protein n=1 Tax=Anaerobiospirillum sp. NML120449 TaxID=2932817 RepID=UPI001FF5D862|nr:hypothetical protein [Anaerobiospirillum sp. NML120449]MCK0527491.1 hypothetical protein [Anaerobiospirillum sp. NML120449]
MNQIYATLLRSLLGNDVIESTLQEVEQNYPVLFDRLAELAMPDGSNQEEMVDYSLHVVDAFLKLKQSEIYQNPELFKVFQAFSAVSNSYAIKGEPEYILRFDTALTICVMALMCGLKDLGSITAYSNYANQYMQLMLPAMLHPRYRISAPNCRSVMRLVNYEHLEGFYTNFFTRAKVATRLNPPEALRAIQPNIAQGANFGTASALHGLDHKSLGAFLPCLGLDHGLILGPRQLLFLCADQLVLNGYDYLLSLNHLPNEVLTQLDVRLAATSNAKILIDRIDSYYDLLDEISEDMQTVVCIKRLNPQTNMVEAFFFLSTLPQVEDSLYLIQQANMECEMSLAQPGSYIMTISRNETEQHQLFLPQRNDYNKFVVNVLSYERDISARLVGNGNVKPWDVILYRNGSNPVHAMVSLFYYFMSDVIDQDRIIMHQRKRMFDLLGDNPSPHQARSLV